MNFGSVMKRAGQIAADNSPAILTAIGVTGSLMTAYLTGKASFKAAEVLRDAEVEKQDQAVDEGTDDKDLTTQEKVELVWHLYIPAASCALFTTTALICANRIGNRRAAALASAYSVMDKSYKEYKAKVRETIGEKKEQTVQDKIAQARVDADPVSKTTIIITGRGNTLCKDLYSGRYFQSDVELIRKAVNDVNALILNDGYASLSDFWDEIGLERTSDSDEVGWNTSQMIDPIISAAIADDGQPCITVDFRVAPHPRHYRNSY